MAGDLDSREHLLLNEPGPEPVARALAPAAPSTGPLVKPLHRYGRLVVVADQREDADVAAAPLPAAEIVLEDLTEVESLGRAAFALRDSAEYLAAKRARPRDGEPWDMPGCGQFGSPEPHGAGAPVAAGPLAGAGAPTSSYLEGSVAVGIIIVEGPNAELKFSNDERAKVVAEVQNGLSWYATTNPAADISFTYDIHTVSIATQPDPNAADKEALWRNPTMSALGYTADWAGVGAYVQQIRQNFNSMWAYCAFFTKYPLDWFAYAGLGGPRLVMDYANDGWGPDNIDRVFAHETGHIFGCPDEYASSGCTCGGSWGRFGAPNDNCQNCAPGGGVMCLMKGNDFSLCGYTPSHLGWGHGVRGNPKLLQSRFGTKGNFELVAPSKFSGIVFLSRNNDVPSMPWTDPFVFAPGVGHVDDLTMIQSNYGSPGNLELVARAGGKLQFFWRDSGPAFKWNGPFQIATGAAGNPALIQSRFGRQGNFELTYPAAAGGIAFKWRNNDAPGMPWSAASVFGQSLGRVDALTMIQSNYGSPGNLELVARAGGKLQFFWRDSGPAFKWNGPFQIATGAAGNPVLVQSRFGIKGNFELVYPAAGGGIASMWRNNDARGMPWSAPVAFGQSLGRVDALTMIQSNYGSPGNLELIARAGERLYFFWRDSGPAFHWNGPWRLL